jgi:hypothetical protein
VPVGRILFTPVSGKDVAGFALIKDGVYDTREKGRGFSGGPQVVVISGFDGKPKPGSEIIAGLPLFPEYRVTVDLPRETTSKDFVIPPAR